MAYKFKYNERPRSYSEEKHGDEDIPSAKAVRDTSLSTTMLTPSMKTATS